MKLRVPELVTKLTMNCDAWIVGSAANPDNKDPRDYDVYVPIDMWALACSIIPNNSKINSLGGFKCISEGKEIDVFTIKMESLFANNFFSFARHPKTGILIKRIK